MATSKKNKQKFTDEEIFDEIKQLSEKAKETSSRQLDLIDNVDLGNEDIDTGFERRLAGTADPDTSHRLYYTMRRTLIDNLPKGKKNEKLRRYVYDEKSLFLNRGNDKNESGYKGSDERMSYIDNFLKTAFDLVNNWVSTGANPFDLYKAFWDINEEKGFHEEKKNNESNQSSLFNKNLEGMLAVPPINKDSNSK